MPQDEDSDPNSIERRERAALVCHYFSLGKTIPRIIEILEKDHNIRVSRDLPYHDLQLGTQLTWLSFTRDPDLDLTQRIKAKYGFLTDAYVCKGAERGAVFSAAAKLLCDNTSEIARAKAVDKALTWDFPMVEDEKEVPKPMRITVRFGVCGGRSMGLTAMAFGHRFAQHVEDTERGIRKRVLEVLEEQRSGEDLAVLKNDLVRRRFRVKLRFRFVNLVSGFELDPLSHPIAFLNAMLAENAELASRSRLLCFNATPFVNIGERADVLTKIHPIKKIRDRYEKFGFDIILTSAGSISDPHSTLSRYYANAGARQFLIDHGVIGDFLWIPFSAEGAFDFGTLEAAKRKELLHFEPMTLVDLKDVIRHVAIMPDVQKNAPDRRDVVLVVAPCGRCGQDKTDILKAILNHRNPSAPDAFLPFVTHLVLDKTTAERAFPAD